MSDYRLAADTWGDEEITALHDVIRSGRFTMGPRVKDFEDAFAEYHGKQHAIMVNSGSSANLAAVAALCYRKQRPLQRGDVVIVPAIAWSTTYSPLQQYGLRLRFVDVDIHTLNVDVDAVEAAIDERTRMIVGVSVLGNPADLGRLRALADKHALIFLEDNCESLGARLDGKRTGTFGDLGTFSFFFSHQVSTTEGGMVVTDDRELADLVRAMRAHGWTRDLETPSPIFDRRDDDFFEMYRFILPGYNLRPTEFAGAVGCVQIKRLDAMVATRRVNMQTFQELLGSDERFIIQQENGYSSSFSFTVILNPAMKIGRAQVLEALAEAGVEHRMITGGCFPRHEALAHYDYDLGDGVPNADLVHDRGFFVGNFPFDLQRQLEKMAAVLRAVCD